MVNEYFWSLSSSNNPWKCQNELAIVRNRVSFFPETFSGFHSGNGYENRNLINFKLFLIINRIIVRSLEKSWIEDCARNNFKLSAGVQSFQPLSSFHYFINGYLCRLLLILSCLLACFLYRYLSEASLYLWWSDNMLSYNH